MMQRLWSLLNCGLYSEVEKLLDRRANAMRNSLVVYRH